MENEYRFSRTKHGQMAEVCNTQAADGFDVDSWKVAGDSFYVLFVKYPDYQYDDEEEDSPEPPASE